MKIKIKFVRDRKNPYNVFTPENATKLLIKELGEEDVEHTGFIALNASNEVLGIEVLTVGTTSQAPFNCAGMFRKLFQKKEYNTATAILFFHNHPSGNAVASQEDLNITRVMINAGKLLGITILDHVIIYYDGYTSIRRNEGYLWTD